MDCEILIADGFPGIEKIKTGHRIKSVCLQNLPLSMQRHTDLQICMTGEREFVCCPECFDYYSENLKPYNIAVYRGTKSVGGTYPEDSAYNIGVAGNTVFLNEKICDKRVLERLCINNRKIIRVKQGYAGCSAAFAGDKALITADRGIAAAAEKAGFDVLLILPGYINLPGFDYGFIGGCCKKIGNKFFVSGSFKNHPDRHKIYNFLKKYNTEPAELSNGVPLDVGSFLAVR